MYKNESQNFCPDGMISGVFRKKKSFKTSIFVLHFRIPFEKEAKFVYSASHSTSKLLLSLSPKEHHSFKKVKL